MFGKKLQSDMLLMEQLPHLVMPVKLSGQQKLPELKNFFPETIAIRSKFFLPI